MRRALALVAFILLFGASIALGDGFNQQPVTVKDPNSFKTANVNRTSDSLDGGQYGIDVILLNPSASSGGGGAITSDGGQSITVFQPDATKLNGTVKVTDGTTNAKVAPASTAAAVADPSLIVGLSPNSPITLPLEQTFTGSITTADVASVTTLGFDGGQSLVTGTPTTNSAVTVSLVNSACASLAITGTWAGTLMFEVLGPEANTWTQRGIHVNGSVYNAGQTTGNVVGVMPVGSMQSVRVRATALASGSATISITRTTRMCALYIANPLTIRDGTGNNYQLAITSNNEAKVAGTITGNVTVDGGVIAVTNFPASQAVTGTFWQATQPVTGNVTVDGGVIAITNFPATQAVTGTFWQATQPVSGTVTSNVGTTNGLALDATLTGGTAKAKAVDASGNVHPAADTAARAEYAVITDLTHTMPTGDAVSRPVFVSPEGGKVTCHAAIQGLVPAAAATDIFTINWVSGTVKLLHVMVTGSAGTGKFVPVTLVRRSTADSGGTSASVTVKASKPTDTCNTTATSYTANPSTGSLDLTVRSQTILAPTSVTAVNTVMPWDFGTRAGEEPPQILATGYQFAVNLNATTVTSGLFTIEAEWTEE